MVEKIKLNIKQLQSTQNEEMKEQRKGGSNGKQIAR